MVLNDVRCACMYKKGMYISHIHVSNVSHRPSLLISFLQRDKMDLFLITIHVNHIGNISD